MSYNLIFMGWNRAIPGREPLAGQLFQEVLQYLAGQQQAGKIDSFEPVILSPHGGDLNGFVLVRGDAAQLSALSANEEWQDHMTRATMNLDGFGVVWGAIGETIAVQMARWNKFIPA